MTPFQRWHAAIGLAVVVLLCSAGFGASDASAYQASVEKWRQSYETELRSDTGWLTVSGLFWMHEGKNTFGSGPGNDIVLPFAVVPASAGYFDLHAGKTVVHINPGAPFMMRGKPVETAELPPDSKLDRMTLGDLTLFVHASGGRFGIRLKDKNSRLRKEFTGLKWYPVNEAYHFTAHFVPYTAPRETEIETTLGDHDKVTLAGYVSFTIAGQEHHLEAEKNDDGSLFIVFRDLTSKTETYQAARFIDTAVPKGGVVELDFNEAYNPPCAYNPYTTCPLPAPGNRLSLEIPAGEKRYHH
ncbi:MAG TPA: DUF1684 domain-containing protein [Candidatus Angelobacter sp.]|nr:DUF1684 domain-containing protein [Candidatus Angelobacter sp.]